MMVSAYALGFIIFAMAMLVLFGMVVTALWIVCWVLPREEIRRQSYHVEMRDVGPSRRRRRHHRHQQNETLTQRK